MQSWLKNDYRSQGPVLLADPRTSTASTGRVACAQPTWECLHIMSNLGELEPGLLCLPVLLGHSHSLWVQTLSKESGEKLAVCARSGWTAASVLLFQSQSHLDFRFSLDQRSGVLCTAACHKGPEAHNASCVFQKGMVAAWIILPS